MDRELTHASFFSGIGGFDLGFELAGFRVVSHAEVKPFSCAVLETRWPGVPNLGDINAICPTGEGDHECEIPRADVWTGGFPCSDFSIMGKRKGLLDGNRSSLGLVFLDLVRRHRPPFVVLENVPGLLTSHEGRDLGLLLHTLGDIGYGWSFRLLDARHFGLPQARRRLFVVAAADPRDAGAVLDDSTDRSMDAAPVGGTGRTALARGRGGSPLDDPFILGPTYAPRSDAVQRHGDTFPLTPSNWQYVPEPIVIERHGHFEPQVKRDGSAYTLLPVGDGGNIGQQYVVEDEPVVLKGSFGFGGGGQGFQARRDGSAYTVVPPGGDSGRQYVVEDEPVVLAGVFPKRRDQLDPSRRDGSSVLEPDDVGRGGAAGDGRDDGPGDGAGGGRARAAAGPARPGPVAGADDAGPGPADHAGGVRAAAGVPGRLDDPDGGGDDPMGPQHLDSARWHVLGRTCPVPVVQWIGAGIAAVIRSRDEVPVG